MNRRVACSLVLLLAVAPLAGATTFTVTSTFDDIDAAPGDGTCATGGGICTLRAAVQEANASPGFDDVTLPSGTFALNRLGAGEDAAANGDLDITQPLTITGASQDGTIIDGVGADRVFHVATNIPLTVRALTIRNGTVSAPGGGIAAEANAAITVGNVTFGLNRAATGGAIFGSTATLIVEGSRFENNLAAAGAGAIAHGAGAASLEIRNSTFADNVAASGDGGALAYGGSGTVTIDGVTLQRNVAVQAAGMSISGASVVTLTNSTVEDGAAIGGGNTYGGVLVQAAGAATIDALAVRRNRTDGTGGGLVVGTSGAISVTDSTIEDNTGGAGNGGMYLSSTAGDVLVQDTTVHGNRAFTGTAGGMRAETAAGTLTLRGVTVEANVTLTDDAGALVAANGNVVVERSRFADNVALQMGGGLYATATGTISVRDTTVQGNQAVDGVGGALFGSNGPSIDVQNSTFADNVVLGAGGQGGGAVFIGSAPVTLTNCTVSGNRASTTGAGLLSTNNPVLIASSTFAGNAAGAPGSAIALAGAATATVRGTVLGTGVFQSCAAAIASEGDNLDQDGTCLLAGAGDRSGIDPQLGPLADNGGATSTHEPLAGSPLIDAFGGPNCPATDQRGVVRPTDGNGDGTPACDVGAVEFVDECPSDPAKRMPGVCGCGVPDADANQNGAVDCLLNAELKARIATTRAVMLALTGEKTDEQKAARANVLQRADDLVSFVTANETVIVKADPSAKLTKLAKKARKALRATRKGKGKALAKKQSRAAKALDALDAAVAPQA
jgi:CSLREA domain-containing protein